MVTVPMEEEIPFDNMTLSANQLTIEVAGTYSVAFMLIAGPQTDSQGIVVGIFINGLPVLSASQAHILSSGVETPIFGSVLATFAAGDVITLGVQSAEAFGLLLAPGVAATLTVIKSAAIDEGSFIHILPFTLKRSNNNLCFHRLRGAIWKGIKMKYAAIAADLYAFAVV